MNLFFVYSAFILLTAALIALDLGVLHKKAHTPSVGEALRMTGLWIALALLFCAVVYWLYESGFLRGPTAAQLSGADAALQYLTGYIIEKSLSLDNIFVIALIMSYFQIPGQYQHRLLFWGILGAVVLRGIMIAAGALLIQQFFWINYVFGAMLVYSGLKLLKENDNNEIHIENNPLVKVIKKIIPVTSYFHEQHFFIKEAGKWLATPMFIELIVVETSDVVFAVDSIPAIFAVSQDPFIVFTSNIFAILGLRSLYFALNAMMDKFEYLKSSLVFVLVFVGIKLIISHHIKIPIWISLSVILGILLAGFVVSMISNKRREH